MWGAMKCDIRKKRLNLPGRNFELLQYLMENKGLVMTRNQILCHVWGYDFDGETRTVDVHVRTLRQKLGEAGNLIETVPRSRLQDRRIGEEMKKKNIQSYKFTYYPISDTYISGSRNCYV